MPFIFWIKNHMVIKVSGGQKYASSSAQIKIEISLFRQFISQKPPARGEPTIVFYHSQLRNWFSTKEVK